MCQPKKVPAKSPAAASMAKRQAKPLPVQYVARKKGTLKSGNGGKGGTVKSRKQAIAIGLSRSAEGAKVPKKKSS